MRNDPVEAGAGPWEGSLQDHLGTFEELISRQGYAESGIKAQLRRCVELSVELAERGLEVENLDEGRIEQFIQERGGSHKVQSGIRCVLLRLLEHLRDVGATPRPSKPVDDSSLSGIVSGYEEYLTSERALSKATLSNYLPVARSFLSEQFGSRPIDFGELNAGVVRELVLRKARKNQRSAKLLVTGLRSFLRFLYLRGEFVADLAAAVPGVASWRLSDVPSCLKLEDVKSVLNTCDRSTAVGRRDYAVLLVLARLGLRAGEVIAMELDDIDWRSGVLTISGKGLQRDRLPVPQDVGEALASYLLDGRPQCTSRRVFVRLRAPHRRFASCVAISSIVARAVDRAGLHPQRRGAHALRHTLASEMLRQGASLTEIGQVLRHRSVSSTEIYAKVDIDGLRPLAQPWPGEGA